jgi:hydrogenase maturation protease
MSTKILIVGVGNVWRRDDGIGPEIIKLLKQEQPNTLHEYLDGGIDALALLDYMQQYKRALIVDAAVMQLPPGTIKVFTPHEAKIHIRQDALSTHGFGLAELIYLMDKLEAKTELKILGVQPQDISFGKELSAEVKAVIPQLIDFINNYF